MRNWDKDLEIGHQGEEETARMLTSRGWKVKLLYDDENTCSLPYDIIAEKDGKEVKIEVKTSVSERIQDSFVLELFGKRLPKEERTFTTDRVVGWFLKDVYDCENNGTNHPDYYIFHKLNGNDFMIVKAVELYSYYRTFFSFIYSHIVENKTGILHYVNWSTYNKPEYNHYYKLISYDINGF